MKKTTTLSELIADNGRLKHANQQLARLVICMIRACNGEIRIPAHIIEDTSALPWLSKTDDVTQELVLIVPLIKP